MKKGTNWLRMLILVLVFGMKVVGCDPEGEGGGGNSVVNPFVGSWKFSVVTLTFGKNYSFSQSGGGVSVSGSYTYDGNTAFITASNQGVTGTTTAVISSNGTLIYMGNAFIRQ